MIHPEVLKAGGIDPEQYTGFAFGLGMTRLAMMKYGVKDIRDLNSGSLTRLAQFTGRRVMRRKDEHADLNELDFRLR